jgi:hypothetical protein
MRYFNEQNPYTKPTLIKFDEPKIIPLSSLRDFLKEYEPFACSDVWLYERFEYGDYDNWINAIIMSKTIDAGFSKVYRKPQGIYKAGQTSFSIVDTFWSYKEDYPFWLDCPSEGYSTGYITKTRYIDKVMIKVEGVFIISWTDKNDIENKYRNRNRI